MAEPEEIVFCQGGGCTAKLGPGVLARVLSRLPKKEDPRLLIGYDGSDDAAVYALTPEIALIQTLDFFPPMVEDPYTFGQIAAANALSDVYAMGGEVRVYTRNGNIQQDDQGQLTIDGNVVLGDNGPIILPPNAIASFGSDGTLSVTPDDGDVTATMDIDRLKLVDIPVANLAKNSEGMLVTADGVPAQRDENIKVSGGFLEGSNVSAVSEMMSSIAMNRQFEAQIKMMKTAEDLSDSGNRLLRGS